MYLPDPDDRHVLAAAVVGHADAIVTQNLDDFPKAVLARYNIEPQHPGEFVMNQIELDETRALNAIRLMRTRLRRPRRSAVELIDTLDRLGLRVTAARLHQLISLI
jgi:hypothetical protein